MKAKKSSKAAKKVAKKTSKPAATKAAKKKAAPKAKVATKKLLKPKAAKVATKKAAPKAKVTAKKPAKKAAPKVTKKPLKPKAAKVARKKVTKKAPAASSRPANGAATEHLIMVPPHVAMPNSQNHMSRAQAKKVLTQWANDKPQDFFGDTPFGLLKGKKWNIDIPKAGAATFAAKLTSEHANLLQTELGFFVGPRLELVPVPTDGAEEFAPPSATQTLSASRLAPRSPKAEVGTSSRRTRGMTTGNIDWSGQAIAGGSIPREFVRSPVLYVVDSGVQPFLDTDWHPEFKTAIESGRIKIRQGRVPSTLADWPYTMGLPNDWDNTPVDGFIVPPTGLGPIIPPYPTPPPTPPVG